MRLSVLGPVMDDSFLSGPVTDNASCNGSGVV